jgi:hypothetical protein
VLSKPTATAAAHIYGLGGRIQNTKWKWKLAAAIAAIKASTHILASQVDRDVERDIDRGLSNSLTRSCNSGP